MQHNRAIRAGFVGVAAAVAAAACEYATIYYANVSIPLAHSTRSLSHSLSLLCWLWRHLARRLQEKRTTAASSAPHYQPLINVIVVIIIKLDFKRSHTHIYTYTPSDCCQLSANDLTTRSWRPSTRIANCFTNTKWSTAREGGKGKGETERESWWEGGRGMASTCCTPDAFELLELIMP